MRDSDDARDRTPPTGRSDADERVFLWCLERTVNVASCLASPALATALVEDTCLRIAVEDWFTRPLSRWRRTERSRWRAEGARLRREGERVRAATELALAETDQPPGPGL